MVDTMTASSESRLADTPASTAGAMIAGYAAAGYAVLEGALSRAQVEELRSEAVAICRGQRGEIPGLETLERASSDDDLMRACLCIHFPHKASSLMLSYMRHPRVAEALTAVIGPNVKAMQSMLFIKASGKPGQAWHQDEYFIPTRDRSLTAAWIALDDATTENGCLWVIPGSHRPGVLYPQRSHGDFERFDCAGEAYDFPYFEAEEVPVEVKAGSVVLFNGYLLHRSLPNRAPSGFRRALVNHYMSAESLLPWMIDPGGSIAFGDFRDIVMVAGVDPHAYRGTADITRPQVRPDGEGGCLARPDNGAS
jgi:ectoine hydroxylase-related dioxygenase (phytanoyl-CoA dioxygenase family)